MDSYRNFHAKILLFGEYSVICNSMGLTMPYATYSGRFQKAKILTGEQKLSAESLRRFYTYLSQLSKSNNLLAVLDLKAFEDALDDGLYFASNIPQSYGVGSSGALCAAVYDSFGPGDQDKELSELKKIFAQMESYFHGTSSGLDPLISHLNKPLLIRDKETLEITEIPKGILSDEMTVFLVDTGQPGKTDNLVQLFLDECRQNKFNEEIKNRLIPLNHSCIQKFRAGNIRAFIPEIKQLSAFFLEHFQPMIPQEFIALWERGLDKDAPYTLKLCGSGGGGFLLGFTTDFEAIKKEFNVVTLHKITRLKH